MENVLALGSGDRSDPLLIRDDDVTEGNLDPPAVHRNPEDACDVLGAGKGDDTSREDWEADSSSLSEITNHAVNDEGGDPVTLSNGADVAAEVERWDAPILRLPDHVEVRDYLVGKGVDATRAERIAATTDVPLSVTKRGGSGVRASG